MTHDPYRDVTWTPGPPPVPVDLDALACANCGGPGTPRRFDPDVPTVIMCDPCWTTLWLDRAMYDELGGRS